MYSVEERNRENKKLVFILIGISLILLCFVFVTIPSVNALSLNEIKQWDCCTNYTIVNNTFTNTTFNNNGTSSHNLLLNLTTYDDHSQYAYLLGRVGGQTFQNGLVTVNGTYPQLRLITGNTGKEAITELLIYNGNEFFQIGVEGNSPSYRLGGSQPNSAYLGTYTSNNLTFTTNNVGRAIIDKNGKFGIATDTPKTALDVIGEIISEQTSGGYFSSIYSSGNNARIGFYSASRIGFGSVSGYSGSGWSEKVSVHNAGNLSVGTISPTAQFQTTDTVRLMKFGAGTATFDAGGNLTSVSDSKAKTAILPFTLGLKEVLALSSKQYHYSPDSGLDTKNTYIGFIAQDVEKVIPDAVKTKDDVKYVQSLKSKGATSEEDVYEIIEVKTGTTTKSLDDRAIIAVLVNGLKEEDIKVTNLEKKITDLELRITKLEGGKI